MEPAGKPAIDGSLEVIEATTVNLMKNPVGIAIGRGAHPVDPTVINPHFVELRIGNTMTLTIRMLLLQV